MFLDYCLAVWILLAYMANGNRKTNVKNEGEYPALFSCPSIRLVLRFKTVSKLKDAREHVTYLHRAAVVHTCNNFRKSTGEHNPSVGDGPAGRPSMKRESSRKLQICLNNQKYRRRDCFIRDFPQTSCGSNRYQPLSGFSAYI